MPRHLLLCLGKYNRHFTCDPFPHPCSKADKFAFLLLGNFELFYYRRNTGLDWINDYARPRLARLYNYVLLNYLNSSHLQFIDS